MSNPVEIAAFQMVLNKIDESFDKLMKFCAEERAKEREFILDVFKMGVEAGMGKNSLDATLMRNHDHFEHKLDGMENRIMEKLKSGG